MNIWFILFRNVRDILQIIVLYVTHVYTQDHCFGDDTVRWTLVLHTIRHCILIFGIF